jgi:hypothetical protein
MGINHQPYHITGIFLVQKDACGATEFIEKPCYLLLVFLGSCERDKTKALAELRRLGKTSMDEL